jgi:hypothetical protein
MFKKISLIFAILSFFAVLFARAQDNTPLLIIELGEQPPVKIIPANAWGENLMVFSLTALRGDVEVSNIVVKQVGHAKDNPFSSVQVREIATSQDIGKARALNSVHEYHTKYNFTVKKGEKREFMVLGNMGSSFGSYDGEKPQFAITAIDSNATVEGLPVTGLAHTINSALTIGSISADRGSLESGGGQSLKVGENYVLNSLRASIGSVEPVRLDYVIWTQSGSVGPEDIANLTTHVVYKGETHSFPTVPYSVGSNPEHEWISVVARGNIRVGKGESVQIYLTGDIVSGVGRTVDFVDFTKVYVLGTGIDYGYGILGYNLNESSAHTISSGSINVAPWNHFFTHYQGEPNIGSFTLRVTGEPKEVSRFEIQLLSPQVKNVKIWDSNGTLVAGPADSSVSGRVMLAVNPGAWIVPIGEAGYTITGSEAASLAGKFNFTAKGTRTGAAVMRSEF